MTRERELVALDVPTGVALESQSGLQMARPRVYGARAGPPSASVGMIVMHPSSNFMGHYLLDAFDRRRVQLLALNSRYVNNDTTLIMERVIQDLNPTRRGAREVARRRIPFPLSHHRCHVLGRCFALERNSHGYGVAI